LYIGPVNHPPVANAGQNQTGNPGYAVNLDGTKSKDPDNDQLKYSWKQIRGPAVTLYGADTIEPSFTAPSNISSDTTLIFKLTVADNKNATNTADVKVIDKYFPPLDKPPIANTGVNQTVNAGDVVTLDGSKSRDPDGNITTYSWVQTARQAVSISGANTGTPSFTAPSVSSHTTLKFSLTVKDNKGAVSNNPATVSVTVKAAVPSSSPSIIPSVSNQTGYATSMTTRENNQTNNATANGYSFKTKWGSNGKADGQFDNPYGVAVEERRLLDRILETS
jgi:large repetitive protein